MANTLGTVSMGIRAPIIRAGDDLVKIVTDSVLTAANENGISFNDKDIVSVTEAVLARAQGNYATVDQIAAAVNKKFGDKTVGLVFPILSRNRFSLVLKGIAKGVKRLIVQLSYPSDEVGNHLVSLATLDKLNVNPYTQSFTEDEFRKLCPDITHYFTGIDYIEHYRELSDNIEIVLSNDPKNILKYSKFVIAADIHSRRRTKEILLKNGAEAVIGLDEILNEPVNGSGYHPEFGLLGSNLATSNSVKLFPRDSKEFAVKLQKSLFDATGKKFECMVYGDGAFKDPIGGIWELADPVVSPGYTDGLDGRPNELKLKYIADNEISSLSGDEASNEIKKRIRENKLDVEAAGKALGTTPRRLTDLIGSLSDLTSGSGDKGTPIILIQNYFKNYAE